MARPRSLNLSTIATAALAVLDGEGLSALSMRSVAAELGMSTMALYRYVERREQIERLVVDLVLSDIDLSVPRRGTWIRQAVVLAGRIRRAVQMHPSVVPLLMVHRHSSPGVMRCAEAFLRLLTEEGFTGRARVISLRTIVSYVVGALEAQHLGPLPGPGTAAIAALPPDTFPLLAETARSAKHVTPDEEFEKGFAAVLLGLDHSRETRRPRRSELVRRGS